MPSLRTGRARPTGMESTSATPRHRPPGSRTAEVLYLLSRGAQLEQYPHMINVHYAAHQPGPTLRDVKARLVALRGKGMPDSFSWSYKRNYKDTFIWCDLFDEDLILPLTGSDEYVLKAMKLFDVASQDGELEELPPSLAIRNTSPSKTSNISRPSSRPEHLHVENDVSMAIKKSLLLINDITSESSMDLNKQIMSNLSHSQRAPEVCSLEHSDVSSSGTVEDAPDHIQSKTTNSSSQIGTTSPTSPKQEKQCNAASQTAHREHRDVVTATMSPSPFRTPRSEPGCARRRTWEREIDKSAIYTQLVCSDVDEPPEDHQYSASRTIPAPHDDPAFLYGVLRKATRLGSSFRPRLCRGVDVVDATRTKSSTKLHRRSKAEEEQLGQATSAAPETKSYASPMTLSEYFDTKERANSNSPSPDPVDRPHPVEKAAPRPLRRPFGNEALDASYRKTMEVRAKLPNSRGACRVHTMAQRDCVRSESKGDKQEVKVESRSDSKVRSAPSFSQGAAPKVGCEHDGFRRRPCSIHGSDDAAADESSKDVVTAPKQRRGGVKKESVASFEGSTVSCRAKARVKTPDEKTSKAASRNVSKESTPKLQLNTVEDHSTKPHEVPESFTSDSRALHSGNKQGVKLVPPTKVVEVTAAAETTTSKMNSTEGAKRWPFEPPVRPRDFKSREDRPLIPGLTNMDWEKSLQEACMHSEPPTNLVLHECSQCGRTFKLESLQVHMRGCRAASKPKPSLATTRRSRVSV